MFVGGGRIAGRGSEFVDGGFSWVVQSTIQSFKLASVGCST
jgi:hypothetical protein